MQRRTIALILLAVVAIWVGIAYLNPLLNPVHVDAARVERGTLFPTVRGAGQVTPKGLAPVQAPAAAKVISIDVSLGQEVKQGDAIATIELVSAAPAAPPAAPAPAQPPSGGRTDATATPEKSTPRPGPESASPPTATPAGTATQTPVAPAPPPPIQPVPSPTPTPPPTPASPSGPVAPAPVLPAEGPPAAPAPPPPSSYTVQPGDTLSGIAQRNGTTVEEIARSNGIGNPDLIFPGQQLSIPQNRPQGGFPGAPPLIGGTSPGRIVSSITSPIDGQIVRLDAKAGQTLAASATIATVADTSSLFLEMLTNQADVQDLAKGQSAQVVFKALPRETVRGKVDEIGRTAVTTAPGVSGYPVKISLEQPPKAIRLGLVGQAEVITRQLANILFVPIRSVFEQSGEAYVFVVEDDRVTKTSIAVGQKTRDYYEVRGGLSEGQTIVASNLAEMYDGLRVSVDKILGPK